MSKSITSGRCSFGHEQERIYVQAMILEIRDFFSDPDNVKAFKNYQRNKNRRAKREAQKQLNKEN